MAVAVPNGSTIYIANGYGPIKALSAITNANPAVGTLAASHGIIVNDLMEVTSGWSRLANKIIRASAVATNDVTFEGFNSTSTSIYPIGSGVGSIREITGFTQLSQILDSSSQGGEQQFLEYQFLESDAQSRIPTVKTAGGMTFRIGDDPSLAGYILASEANDDRLTRAIKILLPSGAVLYYNSYVSLNKIPTLNVNQLMTVEVTLSLQAEPTRYTA